MADSGALVVTEARQQHPLSQIAASETHRLLLKQWVKEEDLLARRVVLWEACLNGARKEIAFLYCAFFAFHSASVLLLFLSSSSSSSAGLAAATTACRRSWILCLVSLLSSLAMIWALWYKSDTEAILERVLAREREDALHLARAKNLRAEAKGAADRPRRWQTRDLAVFAFFAVACGVLMLTRFLLCN
ncbi:uncharacterized protein [Zea mays]|uniref:uncharacterized protein isoform X2 n=1 Tax=Zea mays TaxID=4577 RepID=UPI0016525151|nr:uncharacterized protein LOC103644128 isoform X2 [Zea mays]